MERVRDRDRVCVRKIQRLVEGIRENDHMEQMRDVNYCFKSYFLTAMLIISRANIVSVKSPTIVQCSTVQYSTVQFSTV